MKDPVLQLLDLVADDLGLARELVVDFQRSSQRVEQQMLAALARDDRLELQALAHRHKGGCLSLGLNSAAKACDQLQGRVASATPAEIDALIGGLTRCCDESFRFLDQGLADAAKRRD